MVARALWRSEALRVVPWLSPCTRLPAQGTTLRASDLHNTRATIINPFITSGRVASNAEVTFSVLFPFGFTLRFKNYTRGSHFVVFFCALILPIFLRVTSQAHTITKRQSEK